VQQHDLRLRESVSARLVLRCPRNDMQICIQIARRQNDINIVPHRLVDNCKPACAFHAACVRFSSSVASAIKMFARLLQIPQLFSRQFDKLQRQILLLKIADYPAPDAPRTATI
jgi:hypothetical protein